MVFMVIDIIDLIVVAKETEDIKTSKQGNNMEWNIGKIEIIGGAVKSLKWYWYMVDFEWKRVSGNIRTWRIQDVV